MIALLLACGTPLDPRPQEPVELRASLDGPLGAGGGVLVVQAEYEAGYEIDLPVPEVKGLTFVTDGDPVLERVGQRLVVTQRYRFGGDKGSYEIPALTASYSAEAGDGEASTRPIFIDLAVAAPRDGELADISEPGRVWTIPWGPVAIVGGVTGLFLGGLVMAFRRPKAPPPAAPKEPPDIRALRAWQATRQDPELDDDERAVALSLIFREYAEEVLGFPATAWTTTESLNHLKGMAHLPEGNVVRAKRLLSATDLVKFAGEHAGAELFEELDADLRAFVGSTRPRKWDEQ